MMISFFRCRTEPFLSPPPSLPPSWTHQPTPAKNGKVKIIQLKSRSELQVGTYDRCPPISRSFQPLFISPLSLLLTGHKIYRLGLDASTGEAMEGSFEE